MRILRNILLLFLPILLIVNITRFFFVQPYGFEYRGLSMVLYNIGTFNGLGHTVNTISTIGALANNFNRYGTVDTSPWAALEALVNFFKMMFYVFSIPVQIVIDIVLDIIWVFRFLWI